METLAANLKRHRKARRLSRRVVESVLGISEDVLTRYENDPGLDVHLLPIVKLARYYNTTVEDLLLASDPNIPPAVLVRRRTKRQ
ncbi:helix-turn-helix domain-containing protein [Deinococcus oregonensis]|uniref:Helix-turn-helix domain-containing protein n=1 Tax=Deinococcus oregonensis TaxID=1805970 RepID=A0ABV6B424_9DEIO